MWSVIFHTPSTILRAISHTQIAFRPNDKQVIAFYLRMFKSFRGLDGKYVPLSYDNRAFRDDHKIMQELGLPSAEEISKASGGDFIMPFLAGNRSQSTDQDPWRNNAAEAIKIKTGFDCNLVTPKNLKEKNEELLEKMKNKDLECYFSCWRDPYNKGRWYYGPNGEHLKIV